MIRSLVFAVVFTLFWCFGYNEEHTLSRKFLWEYYGKADIDLKHVFEERNNIIKLQDENKITVLEASFYYHRLHDFNNDGYLDGLELIRAAQHTHTNHSAEPNLETFAEIVDTYLAETDFNGDGLIDFYEFSKYLTDNMKQKNE